MARNTGRNMPVNHIQDGQSGRTVGTLIQKARRGSRPSSETRPLRAKNQVKPRGNARFPFGKYIKRDENGQQDPQQKAAWAAMSLAASLRERK